MIAGALVVAACLVLAQAQVEAPAIMPGSEQRAELAAGGEAVFTLEAAVGGAWTVQASSLDFDVRVSVELETGGGRREDRRSSGHSDAWLVFEAEPGSRWRIVVAAEDGRGGEYGLTVREGRFDPSRDRRERILAAVLHCEQISLRAESQGEIARAARHAGIAAEAAFAAEALERSQAAAERQLALAERGGLADEVAFAALNLGAALRMLGDLDAALALFERAKPRIEGLLAEADLPREKTAAAFRAAFLEENLGDVLRLRHGAARALASYEAAAAHAEAAGNARFAATASLELSNVLAEVGRLRGAREALARAQELVGGIADGDLAASCLLSEGTLELAAGRPARAFEVLTEALSRVRMPFLRLDVLGTLADALLDLGRYEEAERAMDEFEKLADAGTLDSNRVDLLKHRASIAHRLGDADLAIELAEQAFALADARGRPDAVDLLAMLASWRALAGDLDEARALVEDAIARVAGAPSLAGARALIASGAALEALGDLSRAYDVLSDAERMSRERGHEQMSAIARSSAAYVLLGLGSVAAAAGLAAESVVTLEALGDLSGALDAHDTLAKAALQGGDLAGVEVALCDAERLVDELAEAPSSVLRAGRLRSRFAEWGEIAQEHSARLAADPERRLSAWRRVQSWKAHVLLERRAPLDRGDGFSPAGIPAGTAVVDYAEGFDRLYAWVAVRGMVELVDLGPKDAIAADAAEFSRRILDRHSPASEVAGIGARLHQRLIEPVQGHFPPRARTLVVVPSPILAALPFDALVDPASLPAARGGFAALRYLIDEFAVAYAPSASLLAVESPAVPRLTGGRVLILGDPTAREEVRGDLPAPGFLAVRAQDRLADLVRLTKTRDEALDLAALVLAEGRVRGDDLRAFERSAAELLVARTERDVALEAGPFDLYLGRSANAERLLDASGYSAIHVAAHGHVDLRDPRRSGLVLAWEPEQNGLVTLEELAALRLDADLVVLSACETAGGRLVRGEGVHSVAYAFLLAGARNVVATLWRVGDLEASQMMQAFYAEQLAGPPGDVAAALRRAKLSFRGSSVPRGLRSDDRPGIDPSLAHPRYWAGYVTITAPR